MKKSKSPYAYNRKAENELFQMEAVMRRAKEENNPELERQARTSANMIQALLGYNPHTRTYNKR